MFYPSPLSQIFFHNYFLNIYYFILFNGWDWELLFSTLNLNHQCCYIRCNILISIRLLYVIRIYLFLFWKLLSTLRNKHPKNIYFFFNNYRTLNKLFFFLQLYLCWFIFLLYLYFKKKKTWTLIGTQVDSISRSRNEGVTQRWGFWSQAFSSLTLFAEQLYSPSLASIFEHVLLDSSRQVLTWI